MAETIEPEGNSRDHWSLDRRVQPALLIGLAIQSIAILISATWYASQADARMSSLEAQVQRMIAEDSANAPVRAGYRSRIEVLEANKVEIGRRLDRIETKIDRLIEGVGRP